MFTSTVFRLMSTLAVFVTMGALSMAQDGVLDSAFAPPGKPYVHAIQKLRNGNILVGYCQASAGGIMAFSPDGKELPMRFVGAPLQIEYSGQQRYVTDFLEQPDGKIIVIGGNTDPRITRHNADGTLDSAFQKNIGKGPNIRAFQGVLEPNGKITVVGDFTSWNDKPAGKIIRLNPDGTIDEGFNCTGTTSVLGFSDIHLLPDGKYYLAGPNISVFDGQTKSAYFVRIHPNGNVDTTLRAPQDFKPHKICVQEDGKILGFTPTQILRIFPDGKPDDVFGFVGVRAGNKDATPEGLHLQKDGKFIVVGSLTHVKGTPFNNICRVNPDGSIDNTFTTGPGSSSSILTSQLTDDGAILLGGVFFKYDGIDRSYVARLKNATGPRVPENLVTSVRDIASTLGFSVYPHPAKDFVDVELPSDADPGAHTVTLVDMLGRELSSVPCTDRVLRMIVPSNATRGMHFCVVVHRLTGARRALPVVIE
jgi:uncharacterized delta-60 repeat protein